MTKLDTREWAIKHGICPDEIVPASETSGDLPKRTVQQVARRCIILQGVVAVAYGIAASPVTEWFRDQGLWSDLAKSERHLFETTELSERDALAFKWRQEAQWALLWAIQKIPSLGLPVTTCDTGKMGDEILPGPGESIDDFVDAAALRSPGELLAEDDRVYNLHCHARKAMRNDTLPDDLMYDVLWQRHYAFNWLNYGDEWDDVVLDT